MKFYQRSHVALILSLVLTLSLFTSACNDSEVKRAARASLAIATTLDAAVDLKREMRRDGQINASQEYNLTRALEVAVSAATIFNEQVKALSLSQSKITITDRDNLLRLFRNVIDSVTELNRVGATFIENDVARARLLVMLQTVSASIEIIQGALTEK